MNDRRKKPVEGEHFTKKEHSDDELVERIRLGDEKAAELLINRYYAAILRYCRRYCRSLEKAEDLTQETFLKLFKSLPEYEGKKKFKAYLYTIADHLCVDESRKVKVYSLEYEEEIGYEHGEMRRIEDDSEVSFLLNTLLPEQKKAVILRFGEQLAFGEIAKVMGCNMRTAQSRVRNALKIMRKEWENERCEPAADGQGLSADGVGLRKDKNGLAHH